MEVVLSYCENSGFDIRLDCRLSDLRCKDDVSVMGKDSGKLQVFLGCLNDSVGMFGMRFTPSEGCCATRLAQR